MTVAFPVDSSHTRPAWFTWIGAPAGNRECIFFTGDTIGVRFKDPNADAVKVFTGSWQVRNLDGAVVASGTVGANTLTIGTAGTSPFNVYGWYRLYLSQGSSDTWYGTSGGAINFAVWRTNANMISNADESVPPGVAGWQSTGTDIRTRGMSLMGPMRWSIGDAASPTSGSDTLASVQSGITDEKAAYTANGLLDSARPRKSIVAFPNGAFDALYTPQGGGSTALAVFPRDETVDTTNVWVATAAGSVSGVKLTVRSPNSGTIVETYDNLADSTAVAAAVNASSTRLKVFARGGVPSTAYGPTNLGRAKYAGVVTVVAALYPDVTYFEGPINEPIDAAAEVAHAMRLFSGAVKAGNASAKTMGPNRVDINDTSTTSWHQQFVDAGGTTYCDALSFHFYNAVTGGDFPAGRTVLDNFAAFISRNSLGSKPRWMTELGHIGAIYGVLHTRRMSRWWMLTYLLLERYGVPKEQTFNFYDRSHGFWAFPSFFKYGGVDAGLSGINVGGGLDAFVTCMRVFSEEVFGKSFSSALDFGTPGNDLYLGSDYRAGDGSGVVAVAAISSGLGNVTFTVTGAASSLTLSDAQGNLSTVAVTGGQAVVAVGELPVYIRLPTGISLTPYQHGHFPAIGSGSLVHSSSTYSVVASTNGATTDGTALGAGPVTYVNNATLENDYAGISTKPWMDTTLTFPCNLTLTFPNRVVVDHVVIWAGFGWQSYSTLTDFDVQTLGADGTTWTTRATVTDIPSSFAFVSDSTDSGCSYETYWNDRNTFDIAIPSSTATKGVRLVIRHTSSGGAPDEQARAAGDQAWDPMAVIRKIECYADELKIHPRRVIAQTV